MSQAAGAESFSGVNPAVRPRPHPRRTARSHRVRTMVPAVVRLNLNLPSLSWWSLGTSQTSASPSTAEMWTAWRDRDVVPSEARSREASWEMNRQPGTSCQSTPSLKVASTAISISPSRRLPRTPPRSG